MSMISMNDLFYGKRESVLILKDEDMEILETIHRYNYFYAEPPPKPEVSEDDEEENAKETEQPAEEEKDVNEDSKKGQSEDNFKVVLKVPMCCSECEETVTIALKNLAGVDDVETVQLKQMVTVTGKAAPADLLHACRDLKIFRKTQFWSDAKSD